jgi:hypothetical protein
MRHLGTLAARRRHAGVVLTTECLALLAGPCGTIRLKHCYAESRLDKEAPWPTEFRPTYWFRRQ